MMRFQNDNFRLQLHHEAQQWPKADFFLNALPSPSYDILSPAVFNLSVIPGPITSLSPDLVPC